MLQPFEVDVHAGDMGVQPAQAARRHRAGDAQADDDRLGRGTPAAPPSSVPEPPSAADSRSAPMIAAARPAISDIGASSGSPCPSVSVS